MAKNSTNNARKKESSSSNGSTGTPSINGNNSSGGIGNASGNINNSKSSNHNKKSFIVMTRWRMLFGCCCLIIASYFGYLGYLETRVNTLFDDVKVNNFDFSIFCFWFFAYIF